MSKNLTVTVTEGGFDLHDEDEFYPGVIKDIEYKDASESKFGNAQFLWLLRLDADNEGVEEDDEERLVWYFTSAKVSTNERNKLRKTVKWLTGEYPEPGDTLDLGDFIGARIKVMFEHTSGTDDEGKAVTRDKVVMVKASAK